MLMETVELPVAWSNLKSEAENLLQLQGVPDKKHEEYKYCDISRYWSEDFLHSAEAVQLSEKILSDIKKKYSAEEAFLFLFVNDVLVEYPSNPIPGLVFGTGDDERLPAPGTLAGPAEDALLPAFYIGMKNSFFIHLADNAALEKPLLFLHVSAGETIRGNFLHKRIFAGKRASCTIKQVFCSANNQMRCVFATDEWMIQPEANVNSVRIQEENPQTLVLHHLVSSIDTQARFSDFLLTLEGKVIRNNTRGILHGRFAECHLYGLYLTHDAMLADNHTLVDHRIRDCYSNELYKGILDGKSIAVFNGKIFVRKDAQKTNAYQSNRNILLSQNATINTKPQLEIFADDVKCSHGTSTGRLDEAAMFYLKSRGIGYNNAKKLLLIAFADEMAEKIPSESDRTFVRNILESRLT